MCLPNHEIGLLNAWILVIPILLFNFLPYLFYKEFVKRASDTSYYKKREKIFAGITNILFYGIMIYCIWIPLSLETIWFYIGLIIYCLAIIFMIISYKNFFTHSLDEPVIEGVYKISRNPMYFSSSIMFIGIAIASLSWIMIILILVYAIFLHLLILAEERYCLEKYGEKYRIYMEKTPRYFLFF